MTLVDMDYVYAIDSLIEEFHIQAWGEMPPCWFYPHSTMPLDFKSSLISNPRALKTQTL